MYLLRLDGRTGKRRLCCHAHAAVPRSARLAVRTLPWFGKTEEGQDGRTPGMACAAAGNALDTIPALPRAPLPCGLLSCFSLLLILYYYDRSLPTTALTTTFACPPHTTEEPRYRAATPPPGSCLALCLHSAARFRLPSYYLLPL